MKKLIRFISTILSAITILCALSGCSPQQKEARYMKKANRYFEGKQFDKAQIEYMNVVRVNSMNALAWTRLGLIARERGDLGLAYHALTNVAKRLDTNNLAVHSRLGKVYLSAGGQYLTNAIREALFVLEKDPLNAESTLVLAWASRSPAEVGAALTNLVNISNKSKEVSEKPAFHLALAYLYVRQQTNDLAAEAAYKRARDIDPRATWAAPALAGLGNLYWTQKRLKEADDAFRTAAELMPLKSTERLEWAEFKRKTGAAADARRILEEMAAKFPDWTPSTVMPRPTVTLAEMALEERRFDDAQALVAKLLAKNSRDFEAMFLDAKIKIASGKLTDGVKDLERLAGQYPAAANRYRPAVMKLQYELAVAEMANKDMAKADVAVKEALKENPEYTEAKLLQARIDLERGNLASAITLLERMTKEPTLLDSYFLLAAGYVQRGSPEEALKVYRKLSAIVPTNAQVPFLSGLAYRQQRKNAEARTAFEQALKLSPENVPALQGLIELDVAEKKFNAALERADSLVRKYTNAPETRIMMARIYRAQGDTNKAAGVLKQLLEVAPEYLPAFFELADIDLKANRFDEARATFEKILEKNPKDVNALVPLGRLYEQKGDLNQAAAKYERAIEVEGKSKLFLARNNLAYIYAEQGKTNAYEYALQARDLVPFNDPVAPNVADTLGWVLYKRGDYAAALPLFREAAEKLTASAEVAYHKGTAYYMLGEEDTARTALQHALQLEPEFRGKEEVQRELEVLRIDPSKIDQHQAEEFKQELKQHPDDPGILRRLGAFYERTDSTLPQAIESYEAILQKNPRSIITLAKLVRIYSSMSPLSQDAMRKALEDAKRLRDLAPDDAQMAAVLQQLAHSARDYVSSAEKHGRREEASSIAVSARMLWPDDVDLAAAVGRFRFDERDFAGSIPLLRKEVSAGKADADTFYRLGVAYFNLKETKQSRDALQKALDLKLQGPNSQEANKLLAKLPKP